MIKIKKIIIVILILSLLIFSVSCKKEKNIESEIKRENNIPKELIAVLENIDKDMRRFLTHFYENTFIIELNCN